jgi:hypothetical protein
MLAFAAALAVVPSAPAQPAEVVLMCTSHGGLPEGPPPRAGEGTVTKDGAVLATFNVPGPCAAPGFPPNR